MNRLNRDMIGLRPGDVLTNLKHPLFRGHKILVLGRVDESFDFSVPDARLNIARDQAGPWRWNMERGLFLNAAGMVCRYIGPDVKVLEAAGMRELRWYRDLPQPADARFDISADDLLGEEKETALLAKIQAVLSRGTADQTFVVGMQLAIDLIFGDNAQDLIDERRMRLLLLFANTVGRQLGSNTLQHAKEMTDALFGRGASGGPQSMFDDMEPKSGFRSMMVGPDGSFNPEDLEGLPSELVRELRGLEQLFKAMKSQTGQHSHGGNGAARSRTGG